MHRVCCSAESCRVQTAGQGNESFYIIRIIFNYFCMIGDLMVTQRLCAGFLPYKCDRKVLTLINVSQWYWKCTVVLIFSTLSLPSFLGLILPSDYQCIPKLNESTDSTIKCYWFIKKFTWIICVGFAYNSSTQWDNVCLTSANTPFQWRPERPNIGPALAQSIGDDRKPVVRKGRIVVSNKPEFNALEVQIMKRWND